MKIFRLSQTLLALVACSTCMVPAASFAADELVHPNSPPTESTSSRLAPTKFTDCNWLVQYRGRTYDLTPLTKQSLARPLDNDIRTVMERYPDSKMHLELVSKYSRDAKANTLVASGALAGFILTRLLKSHAKSDEGKIMVDVFDFTFIGFFVKGIHESWKASNASKDELANAVDSFNEASPYKIEPAGNAPSP